MKSILSQQDLDILNLAEYLLKNGKTSLHELSVHFSIDYRTLKKLIESANTNLTPLTIELLGNTNAYLKIPDNYSISYLYSAILKNSLEFQILEKLFFKQKNITTSNDFASSLFISPSTLRRKITQINIKMKKQPFYIDSRSLKIVGEEAAILNFIIFYIFERYPIHSEAFKSIEFKTVSQALIFFSKIKQIKIDFPNLHKATVVILALFYRSKNTNTPLNIYDDSHLNLSEEEKKYETKLNSFFLKKYPKRKSFQLINSLYNFFLPATYENLLLKSQNSNDLNYIIRSFNDIVDSICSKFHVPKPQNLKKIILSLSNIHYLQYGKPFILYDKHHLYLEEMNKNHSIFISFFEKRIKNAFGEIPNHQINSYAFTLITQWSNLTTGLEAHRLKIRIAILFDFDTEYVNLLETEITKHLNGHCIIDNLSFKYIDDLIIDHQNNDLLLTNIPGISIPDKPVLCVPIIPSSTDWKNLENIYIDFIEGRENK